MKGKNYLLVLLLLLLTTNVRPFVSYAADSQLSKKLTRDDFIVQCDDSMINKYDNDLISLLNSTGSNSYECFFNDGTLSESELDIEHLTFARNVELVDSTKKDLIDAYGVGVATSFDINSDPAFSGENYPDDFAEFMQHLATTLKESIFYNYKDLYQIIWFINDSDKIVCVYFLNMIYYEADSDTVRLVQESLNQLGYNCGTPDGIIGTNTKSSILAYQKVNGLFESGVVDDELLKSLMDQQEIVSSPLDKGDTDLDIFVDRYNKGVDYYNRIAERDGYSKTVQITKNDLLIDNIAPTGNIKLVVNPNKRDKNPVKIINIWTDDKSDLDQNVATGEIMSMIYAFDTSLVDCADALTLWEQVYNNSKMEQDGILFTNYSIGETLIIKAEYIEQKDNESSEVSKGMENALAKAKLYLKSMSFSYTGLVDQLEYNGYSEEEAIYAVDNCGADWNEEAAKKAKSYIDSMAFSRKELIDQLKYNGFTDEQAEYGVEQVGY